MNKMHWLDYILVMLNIILLNLNLSDGSMMDLEPNMLEMLVNKIDFQYKMGLLDCKMDLSKSKMLNFVVHLIMMNNCCLYEDYEMDLMNMMVKLVSKVENSVIE